MTAHLPALAGRAAKASAAARSRKARERAATLAPVIAALRTEGATTLRALAARLTEAGVAPPYGTVWWPNTVRRELTRIAAQA